MNNYPWDQTIVGWIHITSAAIVVGGLFFWMVARAAANGGTAGWERGALSRFRPYFWIAALLLLLTGGYTTWVRLGQHYPTVYFHVLYTKILFYVILFGIAGALTKPREAPNALQRNMPTWLGVCLALCAVILFFSAFMRRVRPEPQPVLAPGAAAALSGTYRHSSAVLENGEAPVWQS